MMAKIIGLNAQLMLPPFCVERGVNKLLTRHSRGDWVKKRFHKRSIGGGSGFRYCRGTWPAVFLVCLKLPVLLAMSWLCRLIIRPELKPSAIRIAVTNTEVETPPATRAPTSRRKHNKLIRDVSRRAQS